MHYCRFCGKKLAENEICDCEESKKEMVEQDVESENGSIILNILGIIAIICLAYAIWPFFSQYIIEQSELIKITDRATYCIIAAVILTVIINAKDPEKRLGKLLIVMIIVAIGMVFFRYRSISRTNSFIEGCNSCSNDLHSGRCD